MVVVESECLGLPVLALMDWEGIVRARGGLVAGAAPGERKVIHGESVIGWVGWVVEGREGEGVMASVGWVSWWV